MNDCAKSCSKKLANLKFVRFIASLVVSCFVLVLCCFGMAGYFPKVEPNYFTSLITLVVGVWIGYGSSKTANQSSNQSTDSVVSVSSSANSSIEDKEDTPLLPTPPGTPDNV